MSKSTNVEAVAERIFETGDGDLKLEIKAAHTPDVASFTYVISTASGNCETQTIYGADTMQALLLCLAASGDYIRRFHPEASFLGLEGSGLLQTNVNVEGEWRAEATMPLPAG